MTGRAMAAASGLSNDPDFAAKLEAIVGLYLDPPATKEVPVACVARQADPPNA